MPSDLKVSEIIFSLQDHLQLTMQGLLHHNTVWVVY
jgi:hypothetical protein